MEMIITDVTLRDRMRQIKKSREKFTRDHDGIRILSSEEFMFMVDNYADSRGTYYWCDNPLCAYMGLSDVDSYIDYYCPIEDLSEEEIKKIDSLKPCPPVV